MKVRILKISNNSLVDALILDSKYFEIILPSVVDGWRFNFNKHSKKRGFETYVLVKEETPKTVEGCLIFEMKDKTEPYMAFVELAPHNQGHNKEYERIAGCLISFACRLSFIKATGIYKAWLAFDVFEEDKANEIKLMTLYATKYNALRFGKTTMLITPEGGEKLINDFLTV
jgi:hypothetical protein